MKRRTLPTGALNGNFVITEGALSAAERLLPTFRGSDGDHEGMVFLLGIEQPERTIFTSVIAPAASHSTGHVKAAAESVAAAARLARGHGLGLLGQIHSHPGGWTEHSEGDDELVLMPFEGMISIVVPHYGHHGLRPIDSLGVHQYQRGRWVLTTAGVTERFTVAPSGLDIRR